MEFGMFNMKMAKLCPNVIVFDGVSIEYGRVKLELLTLRVFDKPIADGLHRQGRVKSDNPLLLVFSEPCCSGSSFVLHSG